MKCLGPCIRRWDHESVLVLAVARIIIWAIIVLHFTKEVNVVNSNSSCARKTGSVGAKTFVIVDESHVTEAILTREIH